ETVVLPSPQPDSAAKRKRPTTPTAVRFMAARLFRRPKARRTRANYSATMSLASIDPSACQAASLIELETKRVEPSHRMMLTPPECRLRAVLTRDAVPVSRHGISGSLFATMPHRALSGTVLLGPLMVMKMFGQWLGLAM